jgi:hypothetical protein
VKDVGGVEPDDPQSLRSQISVPPRITGRGCHPYCVLPRRPRWRVVAQRSRSRRRTVRPGCWRRN